MNLCFDHKYRYYSRKEYFEYSKRDVCRKENKQPDAVDGRILAYGIRYRTGENKETKQQQQRKTRRASKNYKRNEDRSIGE